MTATSRFALLLVTGLFVVQATPSHAITIDEVAQETVGAPVFAADGHEVGKVIDLSVSDGEIDAVRMKTGAFLGFGERVLDLPKGLFTVLRGAVVLDVPAEAIETLGTEKSAEPERNR